MDEKALSIVKEYALEHINSTVDDLSKFCVFIVWKCKTLQNWKYLISTNLLDMRYYELTYNGDRSEWYLDVYDKIENRVIKHETC